MTLPTSSTRTGEPSVGIKNGGPMRTADEVRALLAVEAANGPSGTGTAWRRGRIIVIPYRGDHRLVARCAHAFTGRRRARRHVRPARCPSWRRSVHVGQAPTLLLDRA